MSGITLGDIANEQTMSEVPQMPVEFEEMPQQQSRAAEVFGKVLTAETGEGSIGDYIEHPMNFNNSKGLAQIIRGVTGLLGNLNLAIVDIVFGALRFSKEKKGVMANDVGIISRGETS